MFNNKNIIITGGTGSFGKELTKFLLTKYKKINKLIIFSRDELKQYEMAKNLDKNKHRCLRFLLGDIRDKERLSRALQDVDYVFHAAALKQVDTAEYNPFEFIKTNIIGSNNLIEACLDSSVQKVLAISTVLSSEPVSKKTSESAIVLILSKVTINRFFSFLAMISRPRIFGFGLFEVEICLESVDFIGVRVVNPNRSIHLLQTSTTAPDALARFTTTLSVPHNSQVPIISPNTSLAIMSSGHKCEINRSYG